jgi:Mg2+/Co2+ transporter CorB
VTVWAIVVALGPSLIILLGIGATIAAAETAMTASSRGRMHQMERDGDRAARRVNKLLSDRENMIGAILLSNTAVNISASTLAGTFFDSLFPGALGIAIATTVMTTLIVIFGEILPKTLAITRPDNVARFLSFPTYWLVRIFGPLARAAQWIVRKTLGMFGIQMSMEVDVLAAHEEIRGAVEYHHSEGLVEGGDRRMLGGVLDLSEMDVSEVMVHRKQMEMLDADLSPKALIDGVLASGHSRIPLYRDEPENIIGVLHAKDLLAVVAASGGRIARLDIPGIAKEPWFIPETTNLKDQLNAFLQKRAHFALVVDEYGALQGLVTLEDILEEIVGEIDDEHDASVVGVRVQPDGSVHVDGDVTIRDLNRAMDWDLPDDEAVTVAGLVIHEAQTIPEPGQVFIFHRHRFQVLRRQRHQITALTVSPRLVEEEEAD